MRTKALIMNCLFITLIFHHCKNEERQNVEHLIFKNQIGFKPESDKPYSGEVFKLDNTGKKEFEGSYKDGLRDGKFTFYKSGILTEVKNYKEGFKNGENIVYNGPGKIIKSTNYKMDLIDGLEIIYDKDLKLLETNYLNGKFQYKKLFNGKTGVKTLINRLGENEYQIFEYSNNGVLDRETKFIESNEFDPIVLRTDMQNGTTLYSISGNVFSDSMKSQPPSIDNSNKSDINYNSNKLAIQYKSQIIKQYYNTSINFAKNYVVLLWGAGSGLSMGVMVDVRDGSVIDLPLT